MAIFQLFREIICNQCPEKLIKKLKIQITILLSLPLVVFLNTLNTKQYTKFKQKQQKAEHKV